ncbi:MAG: ACT domain-containing protein [Candidatus Eisenbacteria bacterium]
MNEPTSSPPHALTMRVLPGRLAVCRLDADGPLPAWVFHAEARFFSVMRTPEETSVVCPEDDVPPSVARVDRGWHALKVDGPLPLTMTGVTAKLTTPLAAAGIPVFALSTYDTDYLLIKAEHLERAVALLRTRFTVVE